MIKLSNLAEGYDDSLQTLKELIRNAQVKAALSVNRELVLLYWQIGRQILTRQQQQGWGGELPTQMLRIRLSASYPTNSVVVDFLRPLLLRLTFGQ